MARLAGERELLRELPDLLLRRPAHDRDVDVDAARAGRLRERRHPELLEGLVHRERGLAHRRERRARHRIEVEVHVVRAVDVVAARVPGVQIDAAEVHDPEERGEVLDHREVDDLARRSARPSRSRSSPGAGDGACFMKKNFPAAPFGIALHDHRPVLQVRKQVRRDVRVVAEQVALGDRRLLPEDFAEIRQPDRPAAGLDVDVFGLRKDGLPGHVPRLTERGTPPGLDSVHPLNERRDRRHDRVRAPGS